MHLVPRIATILLCVQSAAAAEAKDSSALTEVAVQTESEACDPLPGSRITEALMFGGKLWMRGTNALVTLDTETGKRNAVFRGGVRDLAKIRGDLWVLRQGADPESAIALFVLDTDEFKSVATFETTAEDSPFALFDAHGELGLLSNRTIRLFNRTAGSWRTIKWQGELPDGVQFSTASPLESSDVYVGFNAGEFGGGLRKLNTQTGELIIIRDQEGDTGDWNGPPLSGRDQITGLQSDPENPQCVYASIGLLHLGLSRGRIVRVCGEGVTVFFEKHYKEDPFGQGRDIEQTEAIFSLAVSAHGVWAASERSLYFLQGGVVAKEYALSDLQFTSVAGVYLSREIPGVIVLSTDVNWSVSTSGYTPLIVPLHDS